MKEVLVGLGSAIAFIGLVVLWATIENFVRRKKIEYAEEKRDRLYFKNFEPKN